MLKFNRAAANQSVSTPDSALLTMPLGPRSFAQIVYFNGITTGDNPQYLASTGNYQAVGSFNMLYNTAGTSVALANRIAILPNLADANSPPLLSEVLTTGYHLVIVDCDGTTATMRHCPVNATSVIKPTAGSSTDPNLVRELNGQGLMFGSRLDNLAARKSDQAFCRPFAGSFQVTDAEMLRLASGEEIINMGKVPVFYFRADTADANGVKDLGPNNLTFTIAGSPTTVAEPPFSFTGTDPQPVTPTISIDNSAALRMARSDGDSAQVSFSGSYAGAAPLFIDVRTIATSGAVSGWQTLTSMDAAGNVWAGLADIPDGGPYLYDVRSRDNSGVLAESARSTARVMVGGIGASIGSSSSEYLFTSMSGTGYTVAQNTARLSGTTPAWSSLTSTGAGTQMAAALAAALGKPFGWVSYGVAGTTLANWLNKAGTQWQNFLRGLAAMGGKLDFIDITVGSNDAGNNAITSSASHEANMIQLIENVRSAAGQPNLLVIWRGSNRRPPLNPVQADRLRQAESRIGLYPNVIHVQATTFEVATDNVHMSPGPLGFAACGAVLTDMVKLALVDGIAPALIGGPRITQIRTTGNTARLPLQLRRASAVTPLSGITGFTGTGFDDLALTIISAERIAAGELLVTADRPIKTLKYQSGSAPNVSAEVFGNTARALPLLVETEMAVTAITEPDPEPEPEPGVGTPAPNFFVSTIMQDSPVNLTIPLIPYN